MRTDTAGAIEEIRRLVDAMRPPALDELGLVGALRQQARGIRTAAGSALVVEIRASGFPPALPAATEVAAYRIAIEALTNVARHSGSERAEVHLDAQGDRLVVEVIDDGRSARDWTPGVGMSSMSERAAELGGTVTARPDPNTGRGGRVQAVLPLVEPPDPSPDSPEAPTLT